ncbi:hypothetical protein Tco_0505981 [Tanacetum coccineum]
MENLYLKHGLVSRLTTKSLSSWHRPLAPSSNFYDHVNPVTRRTIDQSAGGKLRDLNVEESWALLEDLALYDNKINKITTSCEICSGPHDTQYCMEDPEQAFVEYASSRTDEARVSKAITDRIVRALPSDTVKNPKLSASPVLSARSYPNMDPQCSNHVQGDDGEVMFIELIRKNDDSSKGEPEEEGSTTTEGVGAEY